MTSFRDLYSMRKYDFPEFNVCEPTLIGGATKHHVYKVKGKDHFGEFELTRRYREFAMLRELLQTRFYGLYIPPMPPKKKIGAKDKNYVEVRMHFLDRFLKDIACLPYLYESAEM